MKKKLIIFSAGVWLTTICPAQNNSIPSSIRFERKVVQQNNGGDGKAITTYYFTINGDYAMMKREVPDAEERASVLYTKDGKMCMINETQKTIMVLNMPVAIGEGANIGKDIAQKIKKQPLQKDDKEEMTVTKTSKTKTICGYPAYAYEIKSENGLSEWWYIKADFNPVRIYTMGAGGGALAAKMKDKEELLKNNPMAIPVLNQNYLWAEMEAGGRKGLETLSVTMTLFNFSTAGYTIREMGRR